MSSVEQKLKDLGNTAEEVAKTLKDGCFLGHRRSADNCPITNFINSNHNVKVISPHPGEVTCVDPQTTDPVCPEPVKDFMNKFDKGEFPELELSPYHYPSMQVIILRGPSGCGKSTWAKILYNARDGFKTTICSADDFFMTDGSYKFDPRMLGQAHNWCLKKFLEAVKNGEEVIIVDNTNIHKWEFANYQLIAEMNGYTVQVKSLMDESTSDEDIKRWALRNQHGVPSEVVHNMAKNFEAK